MNEIRGWLLDLYEHSQQGTVLWLLGEDGQRHCLRHLLPVAFYASGPFERLRLAWRWLESQPFALCLDRTQRQDLFAGLITVLAVQLTDAAVLPHLFRQMVACFPDLDYYDVDLPLALRYAAAYDLFPLARCRALVDQHVTGDDFFHRVRAQGVNARKIRNDDILLALEAAFLLLNRNARPVADELVRAGERVEQRSLATVRVAGKRDLDLHDLSSSVRIC